MDVVIATAERPDLLRRTLESLAACERPAPLRHVWVVENGGRRGVEAAVATFSDRLPVRYRFEADPGKCGALNAALREIENGLVVFLDDDVRLAPKALTAYAARHEANPGCYFGGQCRVDYESEPAPSLRRYLPRSAKGWEPQGAYGPERPMLFLGFNWAARAQDVLAAGGFPSHIGPGQALRIGDEDHVQRGLIQRGLGWHFVPEAEVWHWVPAARCTPDWVVERGYHNGRSRASFESAPRRGLAGLPWSWWKRRATAAGRSVMAWTTRDAEQRLRARLAHSINRGLRDGYLQRTESLRGEGV